MVVSAALAGCVNGSPAPTPEATTSRPTEAPTRSMTPQAPEPTTSAPTPSSDAQAPPETDPSPSEAAPPEVASAPPAEFDGPAVYHSCFLALPPGLFGSTPREGAFDPSAVTEARNAPDTVAVTVSLEFDNPDVPRSYELCHVTGGPDDPHVTFVSVFD